MRRQLQEHFKIRQTEATALQDGGQLVAGFYRMLHRTESFQKIILFAYRVLY